MKEKLHSIRDRLDDIDKRIIKALAQRQQVVKEVAALKLANNSGIRDLEREEKLLSKIRDFANEEIKPNAAQWDKESVYPKEAIAKANELGLLLSLIHI